MAKKVKDGLPKYKERALTYLFREFRKSAHQRGLTDLEFFSFMLPHLGEQRELLMQAEVKPPCL